MVITEQEPLRSDDENVRQFEGIGWRHTIISLEIETLIREVMERAIQYKSQQEGKDMKSSMQDEFRNFIRSVIGRRSEGNTTYDPEFDQQIQTFRRVCESL